MQQQHNHRLFDKEADNQHEEPVLMAQLAASQLRALLLGASGANAEGLLPIVEWASRLAQVRRHGLRTSPCNAP